MNTKKPEIINTVEKLLDNNKDNEIIEQVVDDYFKQHPRDIDLMIQFAVFFTEPPMGDPRISISLLEEVLALDPGNPIALVVLAFTYDRLWSGISEELYNKLEHARTINDEEKGMIELAKSWYRERMDDALYEKHLLLSVQYGNKFVWNYTNLANFYRKKGLAEKCRYYAQEAFKNVQEIDTMQDTNNERLNELTTTEEFLNELVKGTHINDSQIKIVYALLKG